MPLHVGKGRNISTAISDIIDYVENPQKTDFGKFIYGYECDTRLADAEFLLSKRQYANLTGRNQGADDVIAYHLRQAFKPGEVTPEEANQIGRELALKLTKGNHAFVVCTHVDKHHVHNHIIINSTTLDCQKKFRNFWGSTWAIRRMNDKLCLEHGLSIVENPKPSREHYGTWLGNKKQPSFQEQIRIAIVASLDALLSSISQERINRELAQEYAAQIRVNEKRVAQTEGFKAKLYENLVSGILTKEEFLSYKRKYNADIELFQKAIVEWNDKLTDVLENRSERNRWINHFMKFSTMEDIDRRAVMQLIRSIRVMGKDELHIEFNYQDEYQKAISLAEQIATKNEERMVG